MIRKLLYATLGLAACCAIAWGAAQPLPGINGPSLGDPAANLYTLTQAYLSGSGFGTGASSGISPSQTSGQANCTQTGLTNKLHYLKTSAGTGYICLPVAASGRDIKYYNATGQTIDVYSTPNGFTPGTADTINGTAGTSAYTSLTTGKNMECFAYANGAWTCSVTTQ
jgi:hypothetical protein